MRPLLIAVVAGLLLAGCFPQPETPAPSCAPGPDAVYGFGDSLSAWAAHSQGEGPGAITGICERFDGTGLSLNAMGGTRVDHHLPTMSHVAPDSCVLVFLGTNDLTNLTVTQATWNALAALNALQAAGARRVVWGLLDTNSASHRPAPALAETRAYNAFLENLVTQGHYGDLLVTYDWRAVAAGHDEFLVDDWVHHTNAGANAYSAAWLAAYQQGCA